MLAEAARKLFASAIGITAIAIAPACGARSDLDAPAEDDHAAGGSVPTERRCLPSCFIGHSCCIGGCDGPAADTPTPCCECFPGEISSTDCPDASCGG